MTRAFRPAGVTGAFRGKDHGGSKKGATKAETKGIRDDIEVSFAPGRQDQWRRTEALFDHQEQSRFVYEQSLHARMDFSAGERRLLRVTILGEKPV